MIKGNKGEWSEIYTLLKVLGDKVLYPGNAEINKIETFVYPIIKILRSESNRNFEYSIKDDIVIISGEEELIRLPIQIFKEKSIFLLNAIKTNKSSSFSVPEIEEFMKIIHCISLKADSSSKTDITIIIHDQRTGQQPTLGFSIKSQLGRPSTLLNAGKTTNFIFKIKNSKLSKTDIEKINSINSRSKIKDRIEEILNHNGEFEFERTERLIFSNNLTLIDSLLPRILAEIVFIYFSSENTTVPNLVQKIEEDNPLKYDTSDNHLFYQYKIKRFLTDVALGMMPSIVWTGQFEATGGYLIVKEEGDILCYHIYNRNEFENYLLHNTKLETASSTRHGFGLIYEENEELFFKLNLQIRFIK